MSDFPRRFGSYVLLKPLARGGMGALYLALSGSEETAKLCVIKTVLPHLADKEYLQRFRDEAKVVVRLSHGNLVPVFDSGQAEGEIYLAMDFVEGRDLRATWNRCAKKGIAFPIDVAAHLVKELARGLHYAHAFGGLKLVHRDVSPPNVLLSYSGEVKLTDFGLASSTLKLEKTAPGIIYGKVSYMSPEQARGEPLDGRTDLYAAGIILWELLTGRQLFPSGKGAAAGLAGNDTPAADELLQRVRYPEITPPSRRAARVPAELDRIATKALAPDLADRYATCEELRRDVAAFLAQTSPHTDVVRVAKFLSDLYGDEIETERREREALIEVARQSLASAGPGQIPRASKAPPPPPPAPMALARPAAPPPAPAPPPAASGGSEEKAARRERGTLVAGPARHDRSLDKREVAPATPPGSPHQSPAAPESSSQPESPHETEPLTGDTEALSASVVGTIVAGRYHVRRLCGEGGMGRVYEAEHIEIGKRVALKILHPAYSQTPDLVERLKREARAASKISHPNVVDVTDSGTTPDGAFFFVMEYIEGIELGELIFREKRLDVPRALAITAQVCRALHAAHQANVIHRDLKPENILILTRDGQREFVKVLDFGIAKSGSDDPDGDEAKDSRGRPSRRLTQPGMTMGTPEYMAPEQATGLPADPRSDVYAMGGILYEMLAGKPPFEGANFMEILNKKANQMPPPMSEVREDVPPELEALITRALAKSPAARPQTMEDLEREIQHLASAWFPPRTEQELAIIGAGSGFGWPSLGRMPVIRPVPGTAVAPAVSPAAGGARLGERARAGAAAWATRLRGSDRRKLAVAAGAALAILIGAVALGSSASRRSTHDHGVASGAPLPRAAAPVRPAAPAPPPAPAPVALPAPANAALVVAEGAPDEPAEAALDRTSPASTASPSPTARASGGKTGHGAGPAAATTSSPADNRKQLEAGERLLRAERFAEARDIFSRLTRSRRDRGPALVGLAEISFQEKDYSEAVRSAERAAADRGGGVRARVLLGDAHFRLNQFKEASKAYQDALKLDPNNASARSGLALANKRM
jgi:serine/threonine protein kinase